MKKQVLIATGLAILSTSAYATKARMDALGQSKNSDRGSFYVEDTRGVFLNPARINSMNDYVVTEWGTSNDAADGANAPHAEGGFFKSMGSFAYGVYFGSEIGAQNAERTTAFTSSTGSAMYHDDAIDLFFGGDAGIQWGARVHYAHNSDETNGQHNTDNKWEVSQTALGLGLGVIFGDLEAYTNLMLTDKTEGASGTAISTVKLESTKFEADLGLNLGVIYKFAGWSWTAEYDKSGYEFTTDNDDDPVVDGAKRDSEVTTFKIGAGKVYEVSSSARLYTDFGFYTTKTELDVLASTGATNTGTETKSTYFPLTIGFEADATSWLALRGSIYHELFGKDDSKQKDTGSTTLQGKSDRTNKTEVLAGATLNFGKLKVDGVVGAGSYDNSATATNTNTGVLKLDNLMTRVAVHYWF